MPAAAMNVGYVETPVYLLNKDSQSPTDGELLDTCTVNFTYAGYHRIPLNQYYQLSKGSRISVVQIHQYDTAEGVYYAVPYTMGLNSKYIDAANQAAEETPGMAKTADAIEGRIGRGESFLGTEGGWIVWLDMVDAVKEASPSVNEYVSFDNISIKAYTYFYEDFDK